MVNIKIVHSIQGLTDYCYALGKYEDKKDELKAGLFSGEVLKPSDPGFMDLINDSISIVKPLEKSSGKLHQLGKELIIPIPWDLETLAKQSNFVKEYMNNLADSLGLSKDKAIYFGAIHNKTKNGKPNNHAHIFLCNREILNEPITKHIKTRYYDRNNCLCKKDDPKMDHCVKAHDETRYFGKEFTKEINGKEVRIMNSKEFGIKTKECWRATMLMDENISLKSKFFLSSESKANEDPHLNESQFHIYPIGNDRPSRKAVVNELTEFNSLASKNKQKRLTFEINHDFNLPGLKQEINERIMLEEIKKELREDYPNATEEEITKWAVKELKIRIEKEKDQLELEIGF